MKEGESKMKTSELCKEIFHIIKNTDTIKDQQLMKTLQKMHGQQKMENIKRRKYDIINILQNSGIVVCQRNEKGQVRYSMGNYILPNYQQKIHNLSLALQEKSLSITEKREIVNRLQRTLQNYEQLMKRNKEIEDKTQKIAYPFQMIEGDIIDFQKYAILGQVQLKAKFDKGAVMKNPLSDCQLTKQFMKVQI